MLKMASSDTYRGVIQLRDPYELLFIALHNEANGFCVRNCECSANHKGEGSIEGCDLGKSATVTFVPQQLQRIADLLLLQYRRGEGRTSESLYHFDGFP